MNPLEGIGEAKTGLVAITGEGRPFVERDSQMASQRKLTEACLEGGEVKGNSLPTVWMLRWPWQGHTYPIATFVGGLSGQAPTCWAKGFSFFCFQEALQEVCQLLIGLEQR